MRYGYLVVEGPHDVEFVGRLLKTHHLKRISKFEKLEPYWTTLIPRTYPPDNDLRKRVPVPAFFQSSDISIAVHSAIGDSNIVKTLEGTLGNTEIKEEATGIGIVIDADYGKGAVQKRWKLFLEKLKGILKLPDKPGEVLKNQPPNTSIFIFPDNVNEGTLETVLLECSKVSYPCLHEGAKKFIRNVDIEALNSKDKKDFKKRSGEDKAIVGCIGDVLRPGKSIQVSIEDNKWVSTKTFNIPKVAAMSQFLEELFDLPAKSGN